MSRPKLIIGCPIRDRGWIIRHWFEHVEVALAYAGIDKKDVMFLFVGDYEGDETFRTIDQICLEHSYDRYVVDQPGTAAKYERVWGWDRYVEMAELRNELLRVVRNIEPDHFWSLDSDILVAEHTLISAFDALNTFDAVGSRCFMTPQGNWCPSYAMLRGTGGLSRNDSEGLLKVDVIMAAKLMTPKAYNVDYVAHRQGEDIGWSVAARKEAGCKLGWDGRTVSKHVMGPQYLDVIDERCGF